MSSSVKAPTWLESKLFEEALKKSFKNFKSIQSFKICKALTGGFTTVMLKPHLEVLLQDDTVELQTFVLKIALNTKMYREQMSKWDMFAKESGMYKDVIPEMEQLYRDKGIDLRFGAKAFELPVQEDYILLEDLTRQGFRNAKRQEALDMPHTKSVLKKLAQWHAASATRVALKGPYAQQYLEGFFHESCKAMRDLMFSSNSRYVLAAARKLPNHEEYFDKLESMLSNLSHEVSQQVQSDPFEFNVLNHADLHCNNIMFQYDDGGNVKETYFVDLQLPRYSTPAHDLLYFVLSSVQSDLKVKCFDELIRYYYDNLKEHLLILEYPETLPQLRDIHKSLIRIGVWGLAIVSCIMPGILCDPTDIANMDNFIESTKDGERFKQMLYFNQRYIQHLEEVLPWLHCRGAFESY